MIVIVLRATFSPLMKAIGPFETTDDAAEHLLYGVTLEDGWTATPVLVEDPAKERPGSCGWSRKV